MNRTVSLRDQIAMAALPSLISSMPAQEINSSMVKAMAETAYEFADAMMEARKNEAIR